MPIHVCVRPPLGPPKSKKSRHAPASNVHLTLIAALTWWYGFLLNIMTGLLDEHSTLNKLLPLSVQMKPQNVLQYIQPIRKSHCHRVKPGQWHSSIPKIEKIFIFWGKWSKEWIIIWKWPRVLLLVGFDSLRWQIWTWFHSLLLIFGLDICGLES